MCTHVFKVVSTSINPASLVTICSKCGERGRVLQFTRGEWDQAVFGGYDWSDKDRVELDVDTFGFNFNSEFV